MRNLRICTEFALAPGNEGVKIDEYIILHIIFWCGYVSVKCGMASYRLNIFNVIHS